MTWQLAKHCVRGDMLISRPHHALSTYIGLTFALSIPFWVVGAVSQLQLLPGLPVSALMLVAPVTAALSFVYGEDKSAGVRALLNRDQD